MKRIIFVIGGPGQGKSYLANQLVAEHSFVVLSVDEAYIDFVKAHCPMLYFEALHLYIGPHYEGILADRSHSRAHLGRDFVAEWRSYLANRLQGLASVHDSVVVEGYLLSHCDEDFAQTLGRSAQVFLVSVENRRYFFQGEELNMESVATIGSQ